MDVLIWPMHSILLYNSKLDKRPTVWYDESERPKRRVFDHLGSGRFLCTCRKRKGHDVMRRQTATLGIRIPPPMLAAVKRAAERDRLHVSELVRAALANELARRKGKSK